VNVSGRKAARRIGRLGRAGHCCCLMNQRPALVLTLAKSSPTLMARPRGPHGAARTGTLGLFSRNGRFSYMYFVRSQPSAGRYGTHSRRLVPFRYPLSKIRNSFRT